MVKQLLQRAASGLIALSFLLPQAQMATAQTVTAIPKLDLAKFVGSWYEIARYPDKVEKPCVSDGMVLYAEGDKKTLFQMVTSCLMKGTNPEAWDANVKLDKVGDGQLKVSYLWPISQKYWVLATGLAYEWALIGAPNHKSLWILSRSHTMTPEVLGEIKQKAAAQGYDLSKLVMIPQTH